MYVVLVGACYSVLMHKSNGLTNGTILQCTKFEDLEIVHLLYV